jgi:hypothetical protein
MQSLPSHRFPALIPVRPDTMHDELIDQRLLSKMAAEKPTVP